MIEFKDELEVVRVPNCGNPKTNCPIYIGMKGICDCVSSQHVSLALGMSCDRNSNGCGWFVADDVKPWVSHI